MSFTVQNNTPYGNVADVCIESNESITKVSFRPHPHGGPECLWFCFRLCKEPQEQSRKVRLVLKNTQNMLGGGEPHNMRPVIRYEGKDWQRLGAPIVEYMLDGRNRAIWLIDTPETFADVAYCYPYGRPELDKLIEETSGYWKSDIIGISQQGRPLIRLSNSYGVKGGNRPGFYLISRQHSGETSGSWVLDGFLRYVATLGESAPLVWSIPLTNIDGVEQGDYGKDNFPYDLNRAWAQPPMRHEVLVFQRDMQRWKQQCKPAAAIDFHAPGACETNGMYCFLPDPETARDHHDSVINVANIIAEFLGKEYAADPFGKVANYKSRWETPSFSRYGWTAFNIPSFTIENPYAMVKSMVLTREKYREAGERIAKAVISTLKKRNGN
ncbi:hypothetical protein GF312_22640 [Candidatus Poribacteria bacterium]|nr:hypothetical protein [Candidatus Poribacteria bacterium]